MAVMSDEQLVQGLLTDAPGAYTTYSSLYGNLLFKFIAARTHNLVDAEEIHNDVLLKTLQTWRPEGGASLKSWLYRLAQQAIADWARANVNVEPSTSLELLIEQRHEPKPKATKAPSSTVLDPLRARLREYVRTLPPGEQQLFQLCFVQEMTDVQVAALTGKTAGSVKTMRCRLVRKIKQALAP